MDARTENRQSWMILAASCALVAVIAVFVLFDQRSGAAAPQGEAVAPVTQDTTVGAGTSDPAANPATAADPAANDAAAAPATTPVTVAGVTADDCVITSTLELNSQGPEVQCLEAVLAGKGSFSGVPDTIFDSTTAAAVTSFQSATGLVVDGIAGRQTSQALGVWTLPQPDPATCTSSGRSAVVDRDSQRSWLCEDGVIVRTLPITTAVSQPDPGSYEVLEKSMNATSTITGSFSRMTHFVVFARGKYTGTRVGFHSVPTYEDGSYIQPLDSVGDLSLFGESSGCLRALPDDATAIWDFLDVGDPVIVIT